MKIQIISVNNGVGLSRDMNILKGIFESSGHTVVLADIYKNHPTKCDINIFCEVISEKFFSSSPLNYIIPNPEWFYNAWIKFLPRFNKVLCKTQDAMRIFSDLHNSCHYISFTSEDRRMQNVECYKSFVHLPGRSTAKNTDKVIEAFKRKDIPEITIIQSDRNKNPHHSNIKYVAGRLPDDRYKAVQNQNVFHVCPSNYEGFGHYYFEAMSTGAIIITTDAPPMNELLSAEFCKRIPAKETGKQNLAPWYSIEVSDIYQAIMEANELPMNDIIEMRMKSREAWEKNDTFFRSEILKALDLC